ncbi:MAG: hypothetical protein L3I99_01470 [Sulfurimonas sp.]|nr:hypothetical protein [Sulfurimonas sp.]
MSLNTTIENYLHRIDAAFKQKSKKDAKLTYMMVAGVIFAFAYLFWDSSVDDYVASKNEISIIQSNINADKAYLQANPETVIANLDNEIKKIKIKLIDKKDQNAYIKSKIETISDIIYDERRWGKYIDSIASNAKKYNVKILEFNNHYVTSDESFGHMLDLNISVTGSYKNTLKFINALEQSDLVADINGLDIKAQDKLNTDLKISVWGIIY